MISRVEITPFALKQVARAPAHIRRKLLSWMLTVESKGLETVRCIRGYHDEPLQGARAEQRSIRLNWGWRAIYVIRRDVVDFVSVREVSKHDY